jgi:hypothetical protein
MRSNRDIVTDAFHSWANGTGYVTSIFADDMTWEITGRSAVSKKYANAQQFIDEVLRPFGARFSPADPFRPVHLRPSTTTRTTAPSSWCEIARAPPPRAPPTRTPTPGS